MPIEEPLPTNKILDMLRLVAEELHDAAERFPNDARITVAVAHLSAAVAALRLPPSSQDASKA